VCHFDGAVLGSFAELARRSGKGYCFPSQRTILVLVKQYHGIRRSRRSLNRHLSSLEGAGYFVRVRRHKRGKDGSLILRSTLYKLKGKFYRYMGLALRSSLRFFSVFRVPFSAQYHDKADQVSIKFYPGQPLTARHGDEKGGPSGILNGISPPSQLEKLRELIKSLP